MADAPLLSPRGEGHLGGEAVPTSTPRSFSYRLDAGNNLLLGSRRSSASSLFGSRRQSSDSLLGSRRGSVYGSRYGFGSTFVQIDDTGIYLSSLAVTIILSALATLGILLFTVVVTLSIMLGQCQDKPIVLDKPNQCASFALSAEVDNLQNWTLPQDCITNAELYVDSGQYDLDFTLTIDAARTFLRSAVIEDSDGLDMVVLDLDDTMLSSLPLLREHHFGADLFKQEVWDSYVKLATMPSLKPMVSLYKELKALNWTIAVISDRVEGQRNVTIKNLNSAGYKDYILILRSEPISVVEFKTKARLELEQKGFRIWALIGDEWSDLRGQAIGKRVFKLPNSLYYT
ncbi:hypothetical protein KC19_5G093800 [Ceratodon purpureus]|uniref:Acid phosphatase n=1 Tax=Ceratodon purpureus TaxID=3225 RepID=A0A8T0I1A2_CERPU|nr:hypothetical protein KC19_5G093800 [Ceratodon purpureus]